MRDIESDWERALHSAGLRLTSQRLVVLRCLRRMGMAKPEEVFRAAVIELPNLSESTVYRVLDALSEARLVTHVHFDHVAPTYRLATEDTPVHLVCTVCLKRQEMSLEELEPIVRELRATTGFDVDVSHIAWHGVCRECNDPYARMAL